MVETKFKFLFLVLVFSCFFIKIQAHPMPNSIVSLHILEDRIDGRAQIPMRDLQVVLNEKINQKMLEDYFLLHTQFTDCKGKKWKASIRETKVVKTKDIISGDYEEFEVNFVVYPSDTDSLHQFIFDYDVVCHQVVTHKVFVLIKQDNNQISETIELDIPTEKIKPLMVKMEKKVEVVGFSKLMYACCFLVFGMTMTLLILRYKKVSLFEF